MLARRLPDVSNSLRPQISASVVKIISLIKSILSARKVGDVVVNGLLALKSITSTMCTGEEGALTDLVPSILAFTKEASTVTAALSLLVPTWLASSCHPHKFILNHFTV